MFFYKTGMKKFLLFSLFLISSFYSFAYISQGNWRWRKNNGSETSATWAAAQNKAVTISSVNQIIRLRVQLQNTTGDTKNSNTNLQYASAPDGPWRYVTNFNGNNAFRFSNSNTYVADTLPTTQQLTGSTNAFFAGKVFVKTNELNILLPNATNSEYEYSLQPTENIQPSTTYYFRIPNSDYQTALPSLTTSANIATKQKLVTNGSFEDSLKDWSFVVTTPATATARLVDTLHKDGIKELSVNVTKTGSSTAVRLTHKAFALSTGHVYMVRFWAFSDKNSAKMLLALKGNGGKQLTYSYKLYTGWQEYQFAFKAFQPNVALHFLFQTAASYNIDKIEILDENNEEVDVPMNYMWQNKRPENEYSWLSADGENSELLPDGRTVWTFSDGWYGYNDTTTNSMSTSQLLRNTFVTQSAPRPNGVLHTITGGTLAQPQALMIPPDKRGVDNFFWPRDMTVENDSLKVLLPEVIQWNAGDALIDGNRQAVAVFSLPDLSLRSLKWMTFLDSVKNNYKALCKADDGYTYAYSSNPISNVENHAIVARFPTGQLSATTRWQYLTSNGWSYNQQNSKEIADVELYSVTRLGLNNYMSLFLNPLSDKVEVLFAQSPVGPWVGERIVGQLEGQADRLSYFGVLHEETESNGVYTFSYSNIGDIPQMLDDKTVYWPTYLKADLKSLSPFNNSPVKKDVLQFTATKTSKGSLLQWKTTSDIFNDHFEIERSADGEKGWIKIEAVKGKPNLSSYDVYDNSPMIGKNYYRLRQYDAYGRTSLSDVRVISLQPDIEATVYPNPSHGDIQIRLQSSSDDKVKAIVTDTKGAVVHQEMIVVLTGNRTYSLHLQKPLAAGFYTLRLAGQSLDVKLKIEFNSW